MFHPVTPLHVFHQQAERLRSLTPGLLDGDLNSIHDARIATRRIREVLPLTHEWQRPNLADDLRTRFRRLGRALGRVRDADVRIELLRQLEPRHSDATATLVLMRQRQEHERMRLMRKLVKQSERLGLDTGLARVTDQGAKYGARFWARWNGPWRSQLRHLIAERAQAASAAVTHATGVYFPKRAHQARIAIKKCRYAAEIGGQTGVMVDEPLVRTLKTAQDLLGDLHDRQSLIDDVQRIAGGDAEISESQMRVVAQVAGADISDFHRRFLERRAEVLHSCERARHEVRQSALPIAALAMGGIVAVTGFEVRRRRGRSSVVIREERPAPMSLPRTGTQGS
jgi:CHAD domain-containing protein